MILRSVYYYVMMIGVVLVIYIFTSFCGVRYLLLLCLMCIPAAIIASLFVEKAGSSFGSFLSGSFKNSRGLNDEFIADLERARHSKANGRYEEAHEIIEGVITSAPEWPDALYLKAQIQWEGFGNATEAKRCLKKVMQLVGYDDTLHRWASSYFDEIVKAEKELYEQRLGLKGN